MRFDGLGRLEILGMGALFLLPGLHPALIPFVGVPSHLLWWVHVLPVAVLSFTFGRRGALGTLVASAALVLLGEAWFGAGYGVPADPQTISALVFSVTATNALVVFFALYARRVTDQYRLLFGRIQVGVLRLARDGRIVNLNPAARELLGAASDDSLVGEEFDALVRIPVDGGVREVARDGSWAGRLEVVRGSDVRQLHVLLAVTSLPDELGYQVLVADRSTEVMHEQELERQAKLASLGEALAGVAHELNNPLAAILANAQLGLMEENLAEAPREYFTVVNDQSKRMRTLLRELLGFSRQSDAVAAAAVHDVLERLVRVQRIVIGKKTRLRLESGWTGTVRISPTKLEQILLNLVSNAAHAVSEHGGSNIVLSTRRAGDYVEVEVRDDGPGIAPEIMDSLFEPFATTKPEGEGTGLGLAISRRLARSVGGDVLARNPESGGAAFTLLLRPGGHRGSGREVA